MAHRSHLADDPGSPASQQRISVRLVSPSLVACRRHPPRTHSLLPVIGAEDVILPAFDDTLGEFAIRAQEGDQEARDALYAAFLPKLMRLMSALRPPYVPSGSQGIWNRDDVAQEAYLVFIDLVAAWSGDVSFTAYVLSRFPWRLKDVIHRGIGKSSIPPRQYGVSLEYAELVTDDAGDAEGADPLLDALLDILSAPLGAVLIAHVVQGKTKKEIAAELGVSRRTMVRYWQEIRAHAGAVLQNDVRSCAGGQRSRARQRQ